MSKFRIKRLIVSHATNYQLTFKALVVKKVIFVLVTGQDVSGGLCDTRFYKSGSQKLFLWGGGGGGRYTRFWGVATPFRGKWYKSTTLHQRGIKVYIF